MSLLRRHSLLGSKQITFVGVAWNPADGGVNSTSPTAVTPPSGMKTGDLVVMIGSVRTGAATLTVSATGGQSWTTLSAATSSQNTTRIFWCRYNGTWSANPSVATGSGGVKSTGMMVFRPTHPGKTWAVNVAISNSTYSTAAAPFNVTITGQTTTKGKTVSIVLTSQNAGSNFEVPSTPNWQRPNPSVQEYENNAQLTISPAYLIKSIAGPTGDFTHELDNSPPATDGAKTIVTFAEQ